MLSFFLFFSVDGLRLEVEFSYLGVQGFRVVNCLRLGA